MKIFNRLLVSILAICLVSSLLVLTGCTNNQKTSSSSSQSTTNESSISSSSCYTSEEISNATTYTLNVKYHAVNEDVSKNTTITYHTLYGFSAYSLQEQRFYYTFKGLEYNGVVYYISGQDYVSSDNKTLSNAIKMQQNKTLDMTAVWECEYSSIYITLRGSSYYEDEEGDEGYWAVYGTKGSESNVVLKEELLLIQFEDKTDDEVNLYYDLNENLYENFVGQYSDLHVSEGNSVTFAEEVEIYIGNIGVSLTYLTDGEFIDFETIFEFVEYNKPGMLEEQGALTIRFVFDIVA